MVMYSREAVTYRSTVEEIRDELNDFRMMYELMQEEVIDRVGEAFEPDKFILVQITGRQSGDRVGEFVVCEGSVPSGDSFERVSVYMGEGFEHTEVGGDYVVCFADNERDLIMPIPLLRPDYDVEFVNVVLGHGGEVFEDPWDNDPNFTIGYYMSIFKADVGIPVFGEWSVRAVVVDSMSRVRPLDEPFSVDANAPIQESLDIFLTNLRSSGGVEGVYSEVARLMGLDLNPDED